MTLRIWMTLAGVLLVVLGLLLSLFPGDLYPLFGSQFLPPAVAGEPEVMNVWVGIAFTRMFGATLFALGLLVYLLRNLLPARGQRLIALVLFMGMGVMAAQAFIQQVSIWNTGVGWALFLLLAALAGGFAFYTFFPRVVVPSPDDMVELEQDLRQKTGD